MTQETKILDFQTIERASEKFANLREVLIIMEIDGKMEPFIVEIYKHFSTLQIKQCVQELVEKLDRSRVANERVEDIMVPYMIFLIIKHFTTLKLPNLYAEQLKAIEHMINTGTMFQIFSAMDEEEVGKIQSEVTFILENFESNMEGIQEFKEQLKESLVDKSLME